MYEYLIQQLLQCPAQVYKIPQGHVLVDRGLVLTDDQHTVFCYRKTEEESAYDKKWRKEYFQPGGKEQRVHNVFRVAFSVV